MQVQIKKRDGEPGEGLPTRALVLSIPATQLLKRRLCHLQLSDPPPPGDYVLVEDGQALAVVHVDELYVVETARNRRAKGYPFTVRGVFPQPVACNVAKDALGVVEDLVLTLAPADPSTVLAREVIASIQVEPEAEVTHRDDKPVIVPEPAVKAEDADEHEVEDSGEGGIHWHALNRAQQVTAEDGAHTHVFLLPSGEVIITDFDGAHAHALLSDAADVAEASTSAHTHALVLPNGDPASTLPGGEHMHSLQVATTAFDGSHTHELELGDVTIRSLTAGEVYSHFGTDEPQAKRAEPSVVAHSKLSTLYAATRGLKLATHALSLIETDGDEIVVMAHGVSGEMLRAIEQALAQRLPESVTMQLRVVTDAFGFPDATVIPLAQIIVDFDDTFSSIAPTHDAFVRHPIGKQRAAMQYVFTDDGFATVLRFQAEDEVISWTLDSGRSETLHKSVSAQDVETVVRAASVDGSRYQRALRGTVTAAAPSVSRSLGLLDHVGKVFGSDVAGRVATVAIGEVEFGLQLGGFHEYFVSGTGALRGVVLAKRDAAGGWGVTVAETLLPTVLSASAVEGGVMPPPGQSGLPASLECEVPAALRYWRADSAKAARALRDALVKADLFRADTVELVDGVFRRVYVRVEQAIATDVAPLNPLDPIPSAPAYVDPVRKVAEMLPGAGADVVLFDRSLSETMPPSQVASLASEAALAGEDFLIAYPDSPASRLALSEVGRLFKLAGHGDTVFVSSAPLHSDTLTWLPAPVELVEIGGSARVDALIKRMGTDHRVLVLKAPDERFVFGIVLEPETVDGQGDIYSADEVRKAAHLYMEEYGHIKLMHAGGAIDSKVKILENYVAPVPFQVDGHPVKKGSWLLGVRVLDDSLWAKVLNGDLTGFSIGGTAVKTPV